MSRYNREVEGRLQSERLTVWVSPEVLKKVYKHLGTDDMKTRSDFLRAAMMYYLKVRSNDNNNRKEEGRAPSQPSRSAKTNHTNSTSVVSATRSDTLQRPLVEGKGGNILSS